MIRRRFRRTDFSPTSSGYRSATALFVAGHDTGTPMRYLIATLLEEELRSREPQLIPFRRDMRDHSFLLMRRRGRIYAWLNVCPHWSLPLGQEVGQVFTRQPRGLRCDTHDARFRLEDGQCFWGPCQGETLEPVPHTVALGRVFFFLPHALREGRGPAEGGEIAV